MNNVTTDIIWGVLVDIGYWIQLLSLYAIPAVLAIFDKQKVVGLEGGGEGTGLMQTVEPLR